jgi:hypothetical protein
LKSLIPLTLSHLYRILLVVILPSFIATHLYATTLHDLSYLPAEIREKAEHFKTDEYREQWALEAMNAAVAYAYGATGKGQTIALMDTPFPDVLSQQSCLLRPKLQDKVDFFPELMTPTSSEAASVHSYLIANLLAAKKDTFPYYGHGIAFDSKVISYNADKLDQSISHALKHNIKIFNMSWVKSGNTEILYHPLQETYSYLYYATNELAPFQPNPGGNTLLGRLFKQTTPIAIFKEAVQQGAVFVCGTGNDRHSEPGPFSDLPAYYPAVRQGWLAVTAINRTGELASYANHCGKAKSWCLAAPGGEKNDPVFESMGVKGYGTSAATAFVSGAIALLKSRFMHLSEQDIAARLLYTANKEGMYADQDKYGQGAIDLAKASMPIGETYFVTGEHAKSPEIINTQHSLLTTMSEIYEDIITQLQNHNMLVFDQFQRAPFTIPVSQFIRALPRPATLSTLQHHFSHVLHQQSIEQGTTRYQFSLSPQAGQKSPQLPKNMMISVSPSPIQRYGFYINQHGGESFGRGQQELSGLRYAKNPYLSFSQQGMGGFYQLALQDKSYVRIGVSKGNFDSTVKENQPNQGKDYHAAQLEIGKQIGHWLLSSHYAAIYNKQGLFQLSGKGGFALADQAYTQVMHAGLEWLIHPMLSWKSNFYHARSQLKSSGIIRTPNPITSQAWHTGLQYRHAQQVFGLYLYQPLTITHGQMKIRAVSDVTPTGQLIQSDYPVTLKQRRRYQLEAFHHYHFKHNAQLLVHANYGKRSRDNTAYMSYLKTF